jgi:hypothetical protein
LEVYCVLRILGDRGLNNVDAEREELCMDPGWLGSCCGSVGEFRAAPLVCRRDIAPSIARTNENRHDANG